MAALNENQGKNNNPSWRNVMYGLKPFVGFAICLASAFFKTGTKVAVKHLNSVSPVLISCIQYLVIGLLAQPIAACRSNIESPFPKGRPYVSTLLVLLCTVLQPMKKVQFLEVFKVSAYHSTTLIFWFKQYDF